MTYEPTSSLTRRDLALVAGLVVLAAASRMPGIGSWAMHVDEYFTFYDFANRFTSFNPAYYWLVAVSVKLFGLNEFSARLPAMVAGIVTVPLFYLLWWRSVGRSAAFVGALLILLSSWHLWYSQFARAYSFVFLLGMVSYYCFHQALIRDRIAWLLGAGAALVAAVLFHLTAVVVTGAFVAVAALVVLLPRTFTGYSRRVALIVLISGVAGLLAMSPMLVGVVLRWDALGQSWGYGPLSLVLQYVKYLQVPVACVAGLGVVTLLSKRSPTGLLIACGLGVSVAAVLAAGIFVSVRPDYGFHSASLVYLAAGVFCTRLASKLPAYAAGVCLIVGAAMLPEFASHYSGHASLHVRDVVRAIERRQTTGDRVLPFVSGVDHYGEQVLALESRVGSPFAAGRDWYKLLDSYRPSCGRATWIVLPGRRDNVSQGLQAWLSEYAHLVWRRYEARFDYTHRGFEVFVVPKLPEGRCSVS